jgi:DNA replication and repair protein RecF
MELQLSPNTNVLSGDNGQGKTSVLEALYFLATSRSFRTERLREVCREGDEITRVVGTFDEAGRTRRQRAVLSGGRRNLYVDDKRIQKLSSYAVRTPMVIFHPGDLVLVSGPAGGRRTLLDRIALFIDPASGEARANYQRAQKGRSQILERSSSSADLDAFEQLMARHGAELQRARQRACVTLEEALRPAFARMASSTTELRLEFLPGGSSDEGEFADELRQRRVRDAQRKSTTFGPHRDDVELALNGRSARHHASQGQQRILTLALKVAELECVRAASGTQPILLLDDVSSELDPTRTGAVYDFVGDTESQVFVTTTRPDLFETPNLAGVDRRDFRLQDGALIEA